MKLIEIKALENGAHRNQTCSSMFEPPEGWAVIPDDMEIPDTFPFVHIEVVDGVVTSMTAGIVPKVEEEIPTKGPSMMDDMAAMLVDYEYRLTLLELEV